MDQNKKIDLHFILKQGRHLICFILVLSFVFFNILDSFAETIGIRNYYHISSDIIEIPYFSIYKANQRYVLDGYTSLDMSRFNSPAWFNQTFTQPYTDWHTGSNNVITTDGTNYENAGPDWVFADAVSGQGYTNLDVSNSYTILVNNWQIYYVKTSGYAVIVDGYVVCDQPFTFVQWNRNNSQILYNGVRNVNTASANGYYTLQLYYYSTSSYMTMTDMDIFISTSNSESGFSNFSDSSTDFVLGDRNNYNFNYNKVDGLISPTAQGDPVIPDESELETIGQYYTYCGIDAFFSSGTAESVLLNYTVSPNEYMRLHPSEYDVMIDVSAVIVTSGTDHPNIPLTYSKSYMQGLETYINSASNPNLQICFDDLLNVNSNDSLADALKGWWGAVTNADEQYYNSNGSVISFGGASISGGTRSLGGYSLNPNLKISDIVFQCSIRVEYNQTDPRQVSGVYRFQQGLISGSRTQLENTIATNFNVPESYNPQYPAPITDSQGNIVVGAGGTNLTVNPVTYNNLNAIVEYLYHIDVQEFLALAGNNQNAIQYALNTLSSTDSNGFFPVLKRTFDIIPDQIWNWIKVSFAVILGGAILGISYRMVRWR